MPGADVQILVHRVGGSAVPVVALRERRRDSHPWALVSIGGTGAFVVPGARSGRGARGRRASAARSAGPRGAKRAGRAAPKARLSQ